MKTITFQEFCNSYYKVYSEVESYRIGQHFCSLFISDSSSVECNNMWNEGTVNLGKVLCFNYIVDNGLDINKLQVLREDLL